MIGGPEAAVKRLDPIFKSLAPGRGDIPRTAGREKAAEGTPRKATCIADPLEPVISSRWSTTGSSTE
jgi:Predicted 6-phosphogluconate dehydrogenase